MATLSLYLDTRKLGKDGAGAVKLVIRNAGTTAHLSTQFRVRPNEWKKGKYTGNNARFINAHLQNILAQARMAVREHCSINTRMPAQKIKSYIELSQRGCQSKTTFYDAFDMYMQSLSNEGSRQTVKNIKTMTFRLMPRSKNIAVEDIDNSWAERLANKISSGGYAENTARNYFRVVKTVYRFCQKKGFCPRGIDPFDGLSVGRYTPTKRALSIKEVRRLWYAEPGDDLCALERVSFLQGRDMFRLIIGLAGMNVIDLYSLTTADVVNGRIEIERSKTGVHISIRIEPEVKEILDRYTRGEKLLFIRPRSSWEKWVDSYRPRAVVYWVNRKLKMLDKRLTSYWLRHTWATLCAELDFSDRTISLGLGHAYGDKINQVYITNRYKKLDEANRAILDYIQCDK